MQAQVDAARKAVLDVLERSGVKGPPPPDEACKWAASLGWMSDVRPWRSSMRRRAVAARVRRGARDGTVLDGEALRQSKTRLDLTQTLRTIGRAGGAARVGDGYVTNQTPETIIAAIDALDT